MGKLRLLTWPANRKMSVRKPGQFVAAWIESNILRQMASAPFVKQDETLVPEAGSSANCPSCTSLRED
jgi:ParB family transcriptional regulator, chromosome partitioning protein